MRSDVTPFLLAGVLTGSLLAQAPTPLPESLRSQAWTTSAAIIYPSSNPADTDNIRGRVVFDTDEQTLGIEWKIRADGALTKEENDVFSLSFAPTAVCRERGVGPTFYVAGYIERTGHVVIERWTFDDLLLGAAAPAGGGTPVSTLSRTLRKSVVVMTTELKPLKTMAYHATADELWVFEEEVPYTVSTIDPTTGAIAWLFDWSVIPAVALTHTAYTTMIDPPAPQSGFVIQLEPWRTWARWPFDVESQEAAVQLYVFRDANLDGVIDESTILSGAEYASRGWWEYINPMYP